MPQFTEIPVVDFSLFQGSPEQRKEALKLLDHSFQTQGLVYLSNRTIPQRMIDEAFEGSKRFFDLPFEIKQRIAHSSVDPVGDHRGYIKDKMTHISQLVFDSQEVQKLRRSSPECKEMLEIGNPFNNDLPPNKWLPEEEIPGFKAFYSLWWAECVKLNHALLRVLSEILELPDPEYLSQKQKTDICHFGWLHYPPVSREQLLKPEQVRFNAHSDYGQLTIVFQDLIGGLEFHDGKQFSPVTPRPQTIILHVGDMLERQTNGRWKSPVHRVGVPTTFTGLDGAPDRYSIVYFGGPDPDTIISTLPGCEKQGHWKQNMVGDWKDEMTAAEWVAKRVAAEYY